MIEVLAFIVFIETFFIGFMYSEIKSLKVDKQQDKHIFQMPDIFKKAEVQEKEKPEHKAPDEEGANPFYQ